LAFLLEPRSEHPAALHANAWVESRRQAGDEVIGLNANYLHAEKNPRLPQALGIVVGRLLQRPLSILLIPHDTRSNRPDRKLLEEATAAVSSKDKERLYMLPPVSPGVVRAVTPALDLLATGRMHAAILALSGGTPAFCFAYQDKFEGLLELFDLADADLLSSPEDLVRSPDRVAEKILQKLNDKDLLGRQTTQHLPAVLKLSQDNFL
jgi:polysaccharide pyruvyl transferase WcaK-like protein